MIIEGAPGHRPVVRGDRAFAGGLWTYQASGSTTVSAIVALWLALAIRIVTTPFVWITEPANGEMAVTKTAARFRCRPGTTWLGGVPDCHPHNHATWPYSYHRTMTHVANEESVIGNFRQRSLAGKDLDVRTVPPQDASSLSKGGDQAQSRIHARIFRW